MSRENSHCIGVEESPSLPVFSFKRNPRVYVKRKTAGSKWQAPGNCQVMSVRTDSFPSPKSSSSVVPKLWIPGPPASQFLMGRQTDKVD